MADAAGFRTNLGTLLALNDTLRERLNQLIPSVQSQQAREDLKDLLERLAGVIRDNQDINQLWIDLADGLITETPARSFVNSLIISRRRENDAPYPTAGHHHPSVYPGRHCVRRCHRSPSSITPSLRGSAQDDKVRAAIDKAMMEVAIRLENFDDVRAKEVVHEEIRNFTKEILGNVFNDVGRALNPKKPRDLIQSSRIVNPCPCVGEGEGTHQSRMEAENLTFQTLFKLGARWLQKSRCEHSLGSSTKHASPRTLVSGVVLPDGAAVGDAHRGASASIVDELKAHLQAQEAARLQAEETARLHARFMPSRKLIAKTENGLIVTPKKMPIVELWKTPHANSRDSRRRERAILVQICSQPDDLASSRERSAAESTIVRDTSLSLLNLVPNSGEAVVSGAARYASNFRTGLPRGQPVKRACGGARGDSRVGLGQDDALSRAEPPQMPALAVQITERWFKHRMLDETVRRHIRQYRDFLDRS
ncbi:hypothetical protein KVT40_002064 [Elsinoe batatas]|uniref:Uncharacterized protein n=1 Tax=Elsinoe batatas TaxID=2601811 RepID=A0A8K0LAC6_9PEZI|nr:hypothetical protein KVT40_002064 [Elsinoe batatas]